MFKMGRKIANAIFEEIGDRSEERELADHDEGLAAYGGFGDWEG